METTLREKLAAYAHDQAWSHWMRYLFSVCRLEGDGSMTIPADKVNRWLRQVGEAYVDLPEKEKESDREQADLILAITNQENREKSNLILDRIAVAVERIATDLAETWDTQKLIDDRLQIVENDTGALIAVVAPDLARPMPRPNPLTDVIDWDRVPDNVQGWMVDETGLVYYLEPTFGGWILYLEPGKNGEHVRIPLPPEYDWRDSLHLRPQKGS